MFKTWENRTKKNYFFLLFILFINFFALSFMFLLPKLIISMGGHEGNIGIIMGIGIVSSVIVAPLSGILSDKISNKILILTGVITYSAGTLFLIFVERINFLIIGIRIIQTAGGVCILTTIFSILSKMVPQENKAQSIAYFAATIQLSYSIGIFTASKILENSSFKFLFEISTLIPLLSLCLLPLLKFETKTESLKVEHSSINKGNLLQSFLKIEMVMVFCLVFLLGGTFGTVLQFTAVYLDTLHTTGISWEKISTPYFLTSGTFSIVLSRIFFSGYSDRHDKNKVIYIFFIALAVSIILMTLIRNRLTSVSVSVIFGISCGFLYPVINALGLSRTTAENRGKTSGVLVMLYDIGYFGFAFLMGELAHRVGFFSMMYILSGILILFIALYCLLTISKKTQCLQINL